MSYLVDQFKNLPSEKKALCLFIPVILLAIIFAWYTPTPVPPGYNFNQATPIMGTAVPKKEATLKTGTIKVIPKDKIKDSVTPLPPEVEEDDVEVTDTAEVAPTENGAKVIATVNLTTGETKMYVKENAPSLFSFENKRRVGAGYGYTTDGGSVAKVFGEYTFLRVGSFHLGVQGDISAATAKSPDAKIFGIVDYRW